MEYRYREGGRGPFAELQGALSELFDQIGEFAQGFGGVRGFPAYEVSRVETGYQVAVDLPGVAREDVDVTVAGRTLTIAGERKQEEVPEGAGRLRSERPLGRFERTIDLPDQIDVQGVVAHMQDGVLTIELPTPARARGRKIEIRTE